VVQVKGWKGTASVCRRTRRRDRAQQSRTQLLVHGAQDLSRRGVERVFQTYSPSISDISVKRRGNVRRAKLYYLRDLSGKAARIEEKIDPS